LAWASKFHDNFGTFLAEGEPENKGFWECAALLIGATMCLKPNKGIQKDRSGGGFSIICGAIGECMSRGVGINFLEVGERTF
jgi:hypothetical protein